MEAPKHQAIKYLPLYYVPKNGVSFPVALVFLLFYVDHPLNLKLFATFHEIRQKRQTVKEGISQLVLEAQKSVRLYRDESDFGFPEDQTADKVGFFAINR